MKKLELWHPIKPQTVLQPFGVNGAYYQSHGINIIGHNGLDIAATHEQPVYAAHDGIYYWELDDKQGQGVVLLTEEPFEYKGEEAYFKTIYWHFTKGAVMANGTHIKAGTLIGYADSTGFSTGDHLHFGLKPVANNEPAWQWYNLEQKNGYLGAIDPTPYFNGFYAVDHDSVIANLSTQISLYQKILALLKKLLGKP